jgi:hypothetical protein
MLALIRVMASAAGTPRLVSVATAASVSSREMPAAAAVGPSWKSDLLNSSIVVRPVRTVTKRALLTRSASENGIWN